MQAGSAEIVDAIHLDGLRAGLRDQIRIGRTADEAADKVYGAMTDTQGTDSEFIQSAAICWLVSEAEAVESALAEEEEEALAAS